jgi:hypothetical protein
VVRRRRPQDHKIMDMVEMDMMIKLQKKRRKRKTKGR